MTTARFSTLACLTLAIVQFAAVRGAIAADNTPPEGFVALFNGQNLDGWKGLVADPPKRAKMSKDELASAQAKADERMRDHWKAVDGALVFDGKGDSLCTAKDYGDFELLVDWKILKDGDSGIYLRGSPQVQIWDPAVKAAMGVGSGGLFNNQKNPSKPTTTADKPVGEWNTFRIRMVGEKVSVWLNDKLVVDNVILENYWDRSQPIYATGQIELQNHGNTLYFKNVYLKELQRRDRQRSFKCAMVWAGRVSGHFVMRVEYRQEIRCTAWQLWPFLDDGEKQKLWLTTLIELAPTSQIPRAVGSTFEFRVREGRRISHYEGRIDAYDPPRHLGVSLWGGVLRKGTAMRVDYRVADLKTHCRLEYYAEIDTSTLPGPLKLAIPLARIFTFFQTRYFMRNLKRLAEAASRGEPTTATGATRPS